MFKIIQYETVWTKKHGVPVTLAKPTGKKLIAEFPTLDAARKYVEGKDKTVIEYPKGYTEELPV